jgi:hypothetical protein
MILKPIPEKLGRLISTSTSGSDKLTSGHTISTPEGCER